jgi:ABC-type nitrate/sulfonate/bicarbonate transport system permease component
MNNVKQQVRPEQQIKLPQIRVRFKPGESSRFRPRALLSFAGSIIFFLVVPAIWIGCKFAFGISDRYLPSPVDVLQACSDLEPNVWVHTLYTAVRLALGFVLGVTAGVGLGIATNRFRLLAKILCPIFDAMRSVPAVAIVPFFLLWFGFAETGRLLLVVTGIAFNIAVATHQILRDVPEKERILFKSFGVESSHLVRCYSIPRILESLLPTVRFSLSTAMGVVIVSELLGSQIGLGYLIQTARNTFSMHVIFLATILLGVLNSLMDFLVTRCWSKAVYWR